MWQHSSSPDYHCWTTSWCESIFVLQSACRKHVSKCLTFTLLFWKVLWPKLLYYLTPSQYSNATSPLCKSLIVLGSKKKTGQEPSFNIDFKQEGWWINDGPGFSLVQTVYFCWRWFFFNVDVEYILNIWFTVINPGLTDQLHAKCVFCHFLPVNLPSPQTLMIRLLVSIQTLHLTSCKRNSTCVERGAKLAKLYSKLNVLDS